MEVPLMGRKILFAAHALISPCIGNRVFFLLKNSGPGAWEKLCKAGIQQRKNQNLPAVFSEIFYDKGWNAYINGELVDHTRVNYMLRGMEIPQGEGQIVFKFLSWNLTIVSPQGK